MGNLREVLSSMGWTEVVITSAKCRVSISSLVVPIKCIADKIIEPPGDKVTMQAFEMTSESPCVRGDNLT